MQGLNLFTNRDGSRKSTNSLKLFFLGIAFFLIYSITNMLLIDPLYQLIDTGNTPFTTFIHCLIIGITGTAICMLFFLLPDKSLVPMTYICLAAVLAVILLITFFMESEVRSSLLKMVLLFGAAPVVIGNAASWIIYKMKFSRKESYSYDNYRNF
ncbi:MAG: hypothetical protein Q4B85_13090 [Lachnospiraceae bacterium]|nr:hypothetical protein [Lachnospiraceae bacterium]